MVVFAQMTHTRCPRVATSALRTYCVADISALILSGIRGANTAIQHVRRYRLYSNTAGGHCRQERGGSNTRNFNTILLRAARYHCLLSLTVLAGDLCNIHGAVAAKHRMLAFAQSLLLARLAGLSPSTM